MKQFISLALILCMISMLTACGSERAESSSDTESSNVSATENQSENENEEDRTETDISKEAEDESTDSGSMSSDSKILVAWFSCTGTTEQIAGWIAEETGADSYEIVP